MTCLLIFDKLFRKKRSNQVGDSAMNIFEKCIIIIMISLTKLRQKSISQKLQRIKLKVVSFLKGVVSSPPPICQLRPAANRLTHL